MRISVMALGLLFGSGCGGAVVSYPRVENPVLLGPVERIGAAPQPTKHETNASFDATFWLTVFSESGGTLVMLGRTSPVDAAVRVLQAELARSQDVHVTKLRASGYVWAAFGVFSMNNDLQVGMEMPKKEEKQ